MSAFTLCMRLATELTAVPEREIILFAYRTADYDELNVWRELDGRYTILLVVTTTIINNTTSDDTTTTRYYY